MCRTSTISPQACILEKNAHSHASTDTTLATKTRCRSYHNRQEQISPRLLSVVGHVDRCRAWLDGRHRSPSADRFCGQDGGVLWERYIYRSAMFNGGRVCSGPKYHPFVDKMAAWRQIQIQWRLVVVFGLFRPAEAAGCRYIRLAPDIYGTE